MKGVIAWLKNNFLFLLLLFIPTQLGKHFWPEWSYILGIRVDYLSPVLYLMDVLWMVFFVFNWKSFKESILKNFDFKFGLVLIFIALNILISTNRWISVYIWLKVGQLFWVFVYFRSNKELILKKLTLVLPIWMVFESLLGLFQVIKGSSLGGIFYYLGERSFNFNTLGIAQMSIGGHGLIRAYGSFSHPNSLAGFLIISLLLWYLLKNKFKLNNVWWWIITWFGILGIIICGSRSIWFLLVVLGLVYIWHQKNKTYYFLSILILVGMVAIAANFISGWDKNSFEKRMDLNVSAIKMIWDSPWLGKGAGNFLVKLPEYSQDNQFFLLQPVHNIFLLSMTEVGLLGILIGLFFVKLLISIKSIKKNWLILVIIVITGFWDHYWFTLPQNMWLLTLVLAII